VRRNRNVFTVILVIVLLVSVTIVNGQAPTFEFEYGKWIQKWLLCGPIPLPNSSGPVTNVKHLPGFEKDYLKNHGGETDLSVKVGQIERYEGGSAAWIMHTTDTFSVDLDETISKMSNVLAYAYCEIESPKDQFCYLALGTNDGGGLWLNGEKIWDHQVARPLVADAENIAVWLNKGRNTLLLKVEEFGGSWGFCVRFFEFDPFDESNQERFFDIVNKKDGTPVVRFLQPESMSRKIFKHAGIQVLAKDEPQKILFNADWTKQRDMPLKLEMSKYREYLLRIKGELWDGMEWQEESIFTAGKRTEHVLFKEGRTDYSIVIGENATESEKWAASELQFWLNKVSGAEFPLRLDQGAPGDHEIIIGLNNHSKALLAAEQSLALANEDAYIYKNVDSNIVIWGGKQRGTMYGVMSFLEREMGCRWYTAEVSVAPQKLEYAFDYLYFSETPTIRVRNNFYYETFEPIWAARNKMNGVLDYRRQPGGVEGYWSVHTFYKLLPPEEFYNSHPEYYSQIDGQRIHEQAQLCLTNPDVFAILVDRLKKTMREHPEYLIYSVSQNDWGNPCGCEKCRAIAEKEESESGPMIWFVNKIAEEVEKEFPKKFVGTLAYQFTRKPCKSLRPRKNVVVRLCSIECCFAHALNTCPKNKSFMDDLTGWASIAPHLYIWDYVVNFSDYIMPYPNFQVLQSNIQTFRDNKAIGVMEQATYQSRGGEFAKLRAYVLAKLLWNPECDVDNIINDFMYGFYGRSGQYVREYFDLLHDRVTPKTHIHLGLKSIDKIYSDEFVGQAEAIFDQAEAVANNEEIRQRVELARLSVMYLKCKRSPVKARYDGTYDRFKKIVAREGITHYAERGAEHRAGFHKEVKSAK
jgi:hypothetical protein